MDTYDPKEVTVTVGGNVLAGFAEEKVIVEREADAVGDEAGADGDVVRFITNDRRGTITVALLQTSSSNAILNAFAKLDETTGNGIFPVVITDNRSDDVHIAASGWIRKVPRAVYRKGVEARVWEIRTGNLNTNVAGLTT